MLSFVSSLALLLYGCNAHMEMSFPAPRMSRFLPANLLQGKQPDFSMKNPLEADGSNFPCKRYPAGPVSATFRAGETIQVRFDGSVIHNGGHCEFSISYNDRDFVAIQTIIKDCFLAGTTFSVQIPTSAPSCERCTFAWSWVNAIGNREFYMNCVDVRITGGGPGPLTGKRMTVANLPGFPRIEEFPPSRDDGRQIYANAPTISITSSGTTSTSGSISQGAQQPPVTVQPGQSSNSQPAGTVTPMPGTPCTNGAMRCSQNNLAWQHCSNGVWSPERAVAAGTRCVQFGNVIRIAFA